MEVVNNEIFEDFLETDYYEDNDINTSEESNSSIQIIAGHVYIIFNEMYQFYGPNYKKIGKAQIAKNRIYSYTTSYIKPIEILFVSELCKNYTLAEQVVFQRISEFRVVNNREFFDIDTEYAINIIKSVITDINNDVITECIKNPKYIKKISDTIKNDIILKTDDINDEEYKNLLEKQQILETTKEEKRKILKHSYKKSFGVDKLNENILDNLNNSSVQNFINLIDDANIKDTNDIPKIAIIQKLITDIGFTNIFDNLTYIKKENLETKINTILQNINIQNMNILFDLSNKITKIENTKQFLGYFNTILNKYNINLKYDRCRIKWQQKKQSIYILEILNNINELIEYKLLKGYLLIDTFKIRSRCDTEIYKSLIDINNSVSINNYSNENDIINIINNDYSIFID